MFGNSKIERLTAEAKAMQQEVKAMRFDAGAEKRDLSPAEATRVGEIQARTSAIKIEINNLRSDDDLLDGLRRMGEDIGLDLGSGEGTGARWGGAAHRASAVSDRIGWGAAVAKVAFVGGRKADVIPSGATMVPVPLEPQVITDAKRARFLADLIPSKPDTTGVFSYMRQSARTLRADIVAKGATKPTTTLQLERQYGRAVKVAHVSDPIPREDLADVDLLKTFVATELLYGLRLKIDDVLVNADHDDLQGILQVSGTQAQAFDGDIFRTTRKAISALRRQEIVPSAVVLNTDDWEEAELATTTIGSYLLGEPGRTPPLDMVNQRLWGLPAFVTNAIPAGTAVVADFSGSMQIWVREAPTVDWTEMAMDDYVRNLTRFRAEMRMGFAVTRPLAVVIADVAEAAGNGSPRTAAPAAAK